jgi:hypothetical protein
MAGTGIACTIVGQGPEIDGKDEEKINGIAFVSGISA